MTDTWAAKVLEDVPRLDTDPIDYTAVIPTEDGSLVSYDAVIAAIARMGAGDDLVERLNIRYGKTNVPWKYGWTYSVSDGFIVHKRGPAAMTFSVEVGLQKFMAANYASAAARIAALTAQRDEARKDAVEAETCVGELEAEAAALTAQVAQATKLIAKMVPLSADGNSVFWDGVGDIELDHNGELRTRAEAAEAEVSALRLKLQAMHRRAQKAEGLSHRSANLLETIMGSVNEAMKPDAKLSLHSLFHRVRAARDHARASSGRGWIEGYYYYGKKWKATEDEAAILRAKVARLEGALERIAGVKGPYGYPFPEENPLYGSFAVVEARAALAKIKEPQT